jgi:hypothetical protein
MDFPALLRYFFLVWVGAAVLSVTELGSAEYRGRLPARPPGRRCGGSSSSAARASR